MIGFISHMGPNTGSGHYVCHIRKEGQWLIFNDEKERRIDSCQVDIVLPIGCQVRRHTL